MIVVSDTTPLNYLVLVRSIDVLAAIFGRVFVPSAVIEELSDPKSPDPVRTWAFAPPGWLTVQDPKTMLASKLDRGEAAALSLAVELQAKRVLLDERDASREARSLGLNVTGTLGILADAATRGLIDIDQQIAELKQTNFRASETLYRTILEKVHRERKAGGSDH